jgi:hypothetical protein
MQSRIMGIVLVVVGVGVAFFFGVGVATGRSAISAALGFVLFSLPFLAVGLYFLLRSQGEVVEQSQADKERAILNAVMTRGRVGVADLAIENNASRDEVKRYVYDLIGKDLFRGYVNWEKGELVSAEAAQIKDGTCPNCGGQVELAGKGLVRCPYCGTETYLSAAGSPAPAVSPAPVTTTESAAPAADGASQGQ